MSSSAVVVKDGSKGSGKSLLNFLFCRNMEMFYLASTLIYCAYVGFRYDNPMPAFGVLAAIVFFMGSGLTLDAVNKRLGGDSKKDMLPGWIWALGVFYLPLCIVLASTTVFVSSVGSSSRVFVIGERTSLASGYLIRMPFSGDMKAIKLDQNPKLNAVATTKDGVQVQGLVTGDFKLIESEDNVKHLANTFGNPNEDIQRGLQEVLQKSFSQAIAGKNLNELSNNLVLEFKTGEQLEPKKFGVKLQGALKVSDLHVYFNK